MVDMQVYLQMHPEQAQKSKDREELEEVLFNKESVPLRPFGLLFPAQMKGVWIP